MTENNHGSIDYATLHQLPWIRVVFSGNKYVQTGNDEFLDPCKAPSARHPPPFKIQTTAEY